MISDNAAHQIDVHSFTFDANGTCIFGCDYPLASLTSSGVIPAHRVQCICSEWMVKFHRGYSLDLNDNHDVSAFCAACDIRLPRKYERFRNDSDATA